MRVAREEVEPKGQRIGHRVKPRHEQQETDRQQFVHGQRLAVDFFGRQTAEQVVTRLCDAGAKDCFEFAEDLRLKFDPPFRRNMAEKFGHHFAEFDVAIER